MTMELPVSLGHGQKDYAFKLDEQKYGHLWTELAARDLSEVARDAEVTVAPPNKVVVRMLSADWLVDIGERVVVGPQDRPKPDSRVALCLLHYLIKAREGALDKNLVPETALVGGDSFFRGVHALNRAPLLEAFGANGPELLKRAQALGGTVLESGPRQFSFWLALLPKAPVQVTLNYGDEEFPAELTFAFDTASPKHCELSVLAFLVALLSDLLIGGYCVGQGLACDR